MAQWKSSRLRLINSTKNDIITTHVQCMDDHDWYGNQRPDKNFENLFLQAGDTIEQNAHLNWLGQQGTFSMLLKYRNNTEDKFQINMDAALGQCVAGFQQLIKTHDVFYVVKPGNLLEITIKHTKEQIEKMRSSS